MEWMKQHVANTTTPTAPKNSDSYKFNEDYHQFYTLNSNNKIG